VVRASGRKNLQQQRHLRRVGGLLIVSLNSPQFGREENQKEDGQEHRVRRRKNRFRAKLREENPPEENGFSNRQLHTTFIPPLTSSVELSRF
jgi:hypothetical protein